LSANCRFHRPRPGEIRCFAAVIALFCPLLCRCFLLFSEWPRVQKMQMNEGVIEISRQPIGAAEQQTPGEPADIVEPLRPRGGGARR
jgi:hypothetical protein